MKTCLRLTIFICLMLPLSAAAEKYVRVDKPCDASSAFTISIPVRLSPDDTIRYRWYCNDVLIPNASGVTTFASRKITYTIPAGSAHSGDVAFHFEYWLDDGKNCWTRSPVYLVSFETWAEGDDCKLSVGVIIGLGEMSCALDSGAIVALGLQGCSLYAGMIGNAAVPDFPSCEMTAGAIVALGEMSCALDSGAIVALGLQGCSLYAGMIGNNKVPDFPSCEMTAGAIVALGEMSCTLNSGAIVGLGLRACSMNAGRIGNN